MKLSLNIIKYLILLKSIKNKDSTRINSFKRVSDVVKLLWKMVF